MMSNGASEPAGSTRTLTVHGRDRGANTVRRGELSRTTMMAHESNREPSSPFILTIVVAVRNPDPHRLDRCISAFAALRHAKKIQMVLVTCGEQLELPTGASAAMGELRVTADEPRGVYAAYNRGSQIAAGEFIGFYGLDDFPLPGLDAMIDEAARDNERPVMFAGPCLHGPRLLRPVRPLVTVAYRNWCHQGLIYRRSALSSPPFSELYPVLADHHANIRLLAAHPRSVRIFRDPVAYFSEGGLSSSTCDHRFRADQRRIARQSFGWIGLLTVVLGQAMHASRRVLRGLIDCAGPGN